MKLFSGIADLEGAVGSHLGYSGWHTVTQQQINGFAHATGDDQWIHVDSVRSATGPYGSTVAHGYLTLSLVPVIVREIYEVERVRMRINYGSNRVRFPAPVRAGSRVRGGAELLNVRPASGGHQVTTRVTIERDGEEKPACVAEVVTVLVP
jgi:acyl dehydratase